MVSLLKINNRIFESEKEKRNISLETISSDTRKHASEFANFKTFHLR